MILCRVLFRCVAVRKPRASGDDPYVAPNTTEITVVNPARAGMIPLAHAQTLQSSGKPRASGDDPTVSRETTKLFQ